jgi:hypothetical protein
VGAVVVIVRAEGRGQAQPQDAASQ